MSISPDYRTFIVEQLAGFAPVNIRAMFGGAGVYSDGVMFGLIADETLYLKVSDDNRPAFEAEGMGPFVYEGKTKPVSMSYYEVPERLYDEPDELAEWARAAFAVALAGKRGQSKKIQVP